MNTRRIGWLALLAVVVPLGSCIEAKARRASSPSAPPWWAYGPYPNQQLPNGNFVPPASPPPPARPQPPGPPPRLGSPEPFNPLSILVSMPGVVGTALPALPGLPGFPGPLPLSLPGPIGSQVVGAVVAGICDHEEIDCCRRASDARQAAA
jgi:hypothetical protein